MLDQHRQHVHGEGVPELVWADVNGQSGSGTALACASEDRLPGVRLDGLPDLGQPENRRLLRRAIVVADDEAATLVGSQRLDTGPRPVTKDQGCTGRCSADEDRPVDPAPAGARRELGDCACALDGDIGGRAAEADGGGPVCGGRDRPW